MIEEILISYKLKLMLTHSQEKILERWVGTCRFLYNLGLEGRITSWNQFRKSENYYSQANEIKNLKTCEGFEWISDTPSQCLQQSFKDLDGAFQKFFKLGAGFPKWRKRGGTQSIRFPDPKQFKVEKLNKKFGLISLPKKMNLKFRMSRKIVGTIKNCTIKKEGKDWYISFCCTKTNLVTKSKSSEIGIDRGISESMVCSSGEVFSLPKTANIIRNRKKVLQRRLRNKKKFSKNWHKDQLKIRNLDKKIVNIRKDFLHKTSTHLAKNHGLIVMEDLKIKNMSRSAKGTLENPGKCVAAKSGLNREILFQGWGMFASMVNYKTNWAGGRMELVNPRFTSQRCSVCLYQDKDNRKGKNFLCLNCGHHEDADLNASKNIKNTAGQAGSDCGGASVSSALEAVTSGKRRRKSA